MIRPPLDFELQDIDRFGPRRGGRAARRFGGWFRSILAALALLIVAGCGPGPEETKPADEALRRAEETSRKAAEAVEMAEEARQIVDEAYSQAEAAQREARLRQRESRVQSAVQQTALALVSHYVETGRYTASYEDLYNYGWRRDADLVYEDIQLGVALSGEPNFIVIVRHQEPDARAFMYNHDSGRGVEAVDRQRADEVFSRPGAAGPNAAYQAQERAVQTALMQTALAQMAYSADKGSFALRYDDLEPYGWRCDPNLIYEDIRLGRTIDGEANFKMIIRHREPGPRAFQYTFIGGRGVEAVDY